MATTLSQDEQLRDGWLAVRYGASPDEWERLADRELRVEYDHGMLVMHAAVSLRHSDLNAFLVTLLRQYVEQRDVGHVVAGPYTMELDEQRKFEPDLFFVRSEHADRLGPDRLRGPADLVIEIASPGTRGYDLGIKRDAYAAGGVPEYWVIEPDERFVYADAPAGTRTGKVREGRIESRVCDGFWLDAGWLWRQPLPKVRDCLEQILGKDA